MTSSLRARVLYTVLACVALTSAGTLAAADGGSVDEVHACILPDTAGPGDANVRIVAADASCPAGSTPAHWPATEGSADPSTGLDVPTDAQAQADGIPTPKSRGVLKVYGRLGIKVNKTKTVSKTTPESDFDFLQAAVGCPNTHPFRYAGGLEVIETHPELPDFSYSVVFNNPLGLHGWNAAVSRFPAGFSRPWQLKVSVVCMKAVAG